MIKKILIFAIGAAVGSLATLKYAEEKYKRIADEEIESVKEVYGRVRINEEDENKETEEFSEEDKQSHRDFVKNLGYTNYSNNTEKEEEPVMEDRPYIISPEEFGELDGYETNSLNYYTDGVLADDDDNIIEDVDELVGGDFADHFGEYEDDSVFVRNDRLKSDYEILMDYRSFSEACPK